MMFVCDSFTTDAMYEIWIDKKAGVISCDCKDSRMRHKFDLVTSKAPRVCKHARAVLRLARLIDDTF